MSLSLTLLLLLAAPGATNPPLATSPPVQAQEVTFENARFQVIWVDLLQADLRLLYSDTTGKPLRTFAAAQASVGGKAVALTNAGIFEPGQKPTGLLISDGQQRAPLNLGTGDGNFYMVPNGIFYLDALGAHVTESHRFPSAPTSPGVTLATQSGPLLLWGGRIHPGLLPGSPNVLIRSGVGVTASNRVALVVSVDKVNFYVLARFFRDGLECNNALYLDGTISRLYAPALHRGDLKAGPFAGILAVIPHPPATGR